MSAIKGKSAPKIKCRGLRARAWWLLRKNRVMTLADILSTVCNGEEKEAEGNVGRWLRALVKTGILRRERVADGKLTSNGVYRYTLLTDIGPKAPVVRAKTGVVFNPNNGQTLPIPGGEHG